MFAEVYRQDEGENIYQISSIPKIAVNGS